MVGHVDDIRGDCPVAFVILKGQSDTLSDGEKKKLANEINEKVRKDVGPIAKLEGIMFV